MIRRVNPVPAAAVVVATMFAPKINSFAAVVVAAPTARTRSTPARSRRHIQRRCSPVLQNANIGIRRRLVERHRHRVAAPCDVAQIIDRLPQRRSRRRAQSANCSCSLRYPAPTAPSRLCHSTLLPPRSGLPRSVLPDTATETVAVAVCGVAAATCAKPITTAGCR